MAKGDTVTWTMVYVKDANNEPVVSYRSDGAKPPGFTRPTWIQRWAVTAITEEEKTPARRIEITIREVPEE